MGSNDRSYQTDKRVRCLNCDTEYTAITTVHEIGSDESGGFIGRHEDPPSGLCPHCGRYEKEEI